MTRFCDLDRGVCDQGTTVDVSIPSSTYNASITSSSNDATFPNGLTTVENIGYVIRSLDNPYVPNAFVDVIELFPQKLTISPTWDGTSFTVTVTIEDLGAVDPPPCNGTGDPSDPDLVLTYTISESTISPTTLERNDFIHPENQWDQSSSDEFIFTYVGKPNSPPAYIGVTVNESFADPKSGGIFDMDDLTTDWKDQFPQLTLPDQAAQIIFKMAEPFTFAFDSNNVFEDSHRGFALRYPSIVNSTFTESALDNKRVGYMLEQTYTVCSGMTWSTEVYRRKHIANDILELKKKHNF